MEQRPATNNRKKACLDDATGRGGDAAEGGDGDRLLTGRENRFQLAALQAVPGSDLLHERGFAFGE